MNDDFKNYIQLLIDNKDKIKHLPERDIHNLLDYITNLQQVVKNTKETADDMFYELNEENEKLNHIIEKQDRDIAVISKGNKKLKSRIEKAVEYVKEMDTQLEVYGDYDILSDNKNDLLNILNGRSDKK